ncbi:mobile mystery protein A [Pedobacter hiemivivus]|uniref:Mobile mystery protein A n=1 Tax=Pedobacter hiemivivus TaxID=2530454 RepID=A0A4U1G464_9SPHI|nr:mobile mystery protein A [Pedobacter hiemivivus]TKC57163.1 mobile mystery protein A [Pedobacter hiemivivus]
MKLTNSRLILIRQLDSKIALFKALLAVKSSPKGWINQIRTSLNMSQVQLAKRLKMSAPAIADLEKREAEGAITLKSLKEAGEALNLKLVYGFVPKDGSLEAMIAQKAREQATKIIKRTSVTMKLEDQENSQSRLEEALAELTNDIKREMPKSLWD